MIEVIDATREQWLAMRGIGGSDAAAACGLDPRKSALALWCEKTGALPSANLDLVEAVQWGNRLESAICAQIMAEFKLVPSLGKTGAETACTYRGQRLMRSRALPWQTCTYDGIVQGRADCLGFIEAKNVGAYMSDEWPDEGMPDRVMAQVWHGFAVSPLLQFCVVGALVGGNELRTRFIQRTECEEQIAALCQVEGEFERMVRDGEQPAADGSASSANALKLLHPDDNGKSVTLDASLVAGREALKESVKATEKAIDAIDNAIRQAMGPATFGLLSDGSGTFSWKTQDRAGYVVKPGKSRVLRFSQTKGGVR